MRRRTKLKSENPRLESVVRAAWRNLYGHDPAGVVFEHGQWWVVAAGKIFSVHDAAGNASWVSRGLCFEEC